MNTLDKYIVIFWTIVVILSFFVKIVSQYAIFFLLSGLVVRMIATGIEYLRRAKEENANG